MSSQQQDVPCAETGLAQGGKGGDPPPLPEPGGQLQAGAGGQVGAQGRAGSGWAGQGERPAAGPGLREGKQLPARCTHPPGRRCDRRPLARGWTPAAPCSSGERYLSRGRTCWPSPTSHRDHRCHRNMRRQSYGHSWDPECKEPGRNPAPGTQGPLREPSPRACTGPLSGGHPPRTWDRRDQFLEKPSPPPDSP